MNKVNILKLNKGNGVSAYYKPSYVDMSEQQIINEIVAKTGTLIKTLTQEQYKFSEMLIKNGWTLCNCFYGEKSKANKNVTTLKSTPNWFKYIGINPQFMQGNKVYDEYEILESVSDYTLCVNYENGIIYLYDNTMSVPELIGTYHCYDDIVRSLKHLKRCIPASLEAFYNIHINNEESEFDKGKKICELGDIYYEIDLSRMKEISEEDVEKNKEKYMVIDFKY